jgi:excisionase family DNA binding protein
VDFEENIRNQVAEEVRKAVQKEIKLFRIARATVTVEEAAGILGISRGLAYEGVRNGTIPSIRMGSRFLIPRRLLARMLSGTQARTSGMDEGGEDC